MVSVLFGPPTSAGGTWLKEMIGVEFGDEPQAHARRQTASKQALFRPAAIFQCSLKLTSPNARRNACLRALTVLTRGSMKNSSAKRNQPSLTTLGITQLNK